MLQHTQNPVYYNSSINTFLLKKQTRILVRNKFSLLHVITFPAVEYIHSFAICVEVMDRYLQQTLSKQVFFFFFFFQYQAILLLVPFFLSHNNMTFCLLTWIFMVHNGNTLVSMNAPLFSALLEIFFAPICVQRVTPELYVECALKCYIRIHAKCLLFLCICNQNLKFSPNSLYDCQLTRHGTDILGCIRKCLVSVSYLIRKSRLTISLYSCQAICPYVCPSITTLKLV